MAQQSLVETGIDRVRSAVNQATRRIQKLQKQVDTRRRKLEQRAQKEVARLVGQAQKLPLVRRAAALRDDASRQIETGFETILGSLQIASRGEVERLDRKLGQLSRKLREIEKGAEETA